MHALAFCPTARLIYNTRYSLQRICDWQDQALLLAYVGTSLGTKLREQYLVRGVLDAHFLAAALMNVRSSEAAADPLVDRLRLYWRAATQVAPNDEEE